MLAYLYGTLVEKHPPQVVIDISGVAYEVWVPLSTFWKLGEIGQPQKLYIHMIVREDSHTLYGFATDTDKRFFNQLLKVNGIGPKVALGILSGLSVTECHQAILSKDVAMLTRIPGIGKKTAERLIIEIQDKLEGLPIALGTSRAQQDALEALQSLGYTAKEAQKAIAKVGKTIDNSESLIKQALQGLNS
jgi:Holliday junction DNA helicase RuvA